MPAAPTAFLSHKSEDAALARQLCDSLEKFGVRCWIAPRDIPPGRSWADSIVEGIEGCEAFILLATSRSVLSRDVLIEVERAHRLSRTIYTVMIDGPRLSGEITYYLTRLQWLETKSGNIDQAGSRLAEVLHGTRRWQSVATPPSLGRRIRSTLPSFAGAGAAVLLGLLVCGLAGWYALHRTRQAIASDYHSLGWTTVDNMEITDRSGPLAVGHVWLGDGSEPFAEVGLRLRFRTSEGAEHLLDLSSQLPAEGTREAEFSFTVPKDMSTFTTFVAVPKRAQVFCVTQQFAVSSDRVVRTGEVKVTTVRDPRLCSR